MNFAHSVVCASAWSASRLGLLCLGLLLLALAPVQAEELSSGDALLQEYFRAETARLTDASLTDIKTAQDWQAHQQTYRNQLQEMLGLSPWPKKEPLNPVISGRIEHDDIIVEKLSFQSRPGLYVTANLYRPKTVDAPLPAILYVCGHASARKNGISFGNKTGYQRHGIWFARNGYVCLTIDTIQLGEIQGLHHGTHNKNLWNWLSRGYTPAGVEAWNGIRALDYLQSRAEVDPERIGLTGRSGGGAYTWFIAALDERVKVAVPVAGITSLKNHVVDGCVAGHCDCMYPVNLYEWDFPQMAALVAPRPLLISNTDKDLIFPLDGVVDVYHKTRRIYHLLGAEKNVGLCIAEGGHKDIQQLRNDAFHWFNRFLKNEDPLISMVAEPQFEPAELRVFQTLPADERVTTAQDWFVPSRSLLAISQDAAQFSQHVEQARSQILSRGVPKAKSQQKTTPLNKGTWTNTDTGLRLQEFQVSVGHPYQLSLYLLDHGERQPEDPVKVEVLDQPQWELRMAQLQALFPQMAEGQAVSPAKTPLPKWTGTWAFVVPRGVGPTRWSGDEKALIHIRRRFYLLGTTRDRVQAEDILQSMAAVMRITQAPVSSMQVEARGEAANWVLLATFLTPYREHAACGQIRLTALPTDPPKRAQLLGIEQLLDWNDLLANAATKTEKLQLVAEHKQDAPIYQQAADAAAKSAIGQIEVSSK